MPATPVPGGEVGHPRRGRTAANPLREAEQEGAAIEDGFGKRFIRARLAERMAIEREDAAVTGARRLTGKLRDGEDAGRSFRSPAGDHGLRHAVHGIGDGAPSPSRPRRSSEQRRDAPARSGPRPPRQ